MFKKLMVDPKYNIIRFRFTILELVYSTLEYLNPIVVTLYASLT